MSPISKGCKIGQNEESKTIAGPDGFPTNQIQQANAPPPQEMNMTDKE